MVLLLRLDVPPYICQSRSADGKGGIALLPGKRRKLHVFMNPNGRSLFYFPHKIGQRMGGPKFDEKVDMIGRAANDRASCAEFVYASS